MSIRLQPGFFDIHERITKLTEMGDPLVGLKEQIDWEASRPGLNVMYDKPGKSRAGAKPIDLGT
jgi:transposase, IS5 family